MPKAKVEIDTERCKGCYLCIEACPKKCLEKSDQFSKTGYFPATFAKDECIGCQTCARVCPDLAIKVYKE